MRGWTCGAGPAAPSRAWRLGWDMKLLKSRSSSVRVLKGISSSVIRWLAIFSILLWPLIAWAWVRSYEVGDYFGSDRSGIGVFTSRGKLEFGIRSPDETAPKWYFETLDLVAPSLDKFKDHPDVPLDVEMIRIRFPGFYLAKSHDFQRLFGTWWDGCISFTWFAIVAVVAPGLLAIRLLLPLRRWSRGHCSNCGYDLRASVDRCPECGSLRGP